jgi:hypothetical protein
MRLMAHPLTHDNEAVGASGSSPVSDFRLQSTGDLLLAPAISLFSKQDSELFENFGRRRERWGKKTEKSGSER